MTYPRLFSLSTVGILKHYVHDYLFHPLRTDFIGPNGVGKSIVADLLQLLFVQDASLIKFGTDGVKKEVRSVHKLPYNLGVAYSFLNIEVEPQKFLTIGIAISNQTNSRVVSFVIAAGADTAGDSNQLWLRKEQLLFANDFVTGDTIPDWKNLAAHLLDTRGLYLTAYKTKEDTKRYYQFLYDKNILHINLAVEENLKAFAKVIQSFSKAKSLDLSSGKASRSLKEFLFEESDAELTENYRKQQADLEKLLRQYAELSAFIEILSRKQTALLHLRRLDQLKQNGFRDFKIGEVRAAENNSRQIEHSENELRDEVRGQKQRSERLQSILRRLPHLKSLLDESHNSATYNDELYRSYQEAFAKRETVDGELTELRLLNVSTVEESWTEPFKEYDVSSRTTELFKEMIGIGKPYFAAYHSLEEIEAAYERQRSEMHRLTTGVKTSLKEVEKLMDILSNASDDSVLGWALQNEQSLTEEQRNIVLYFATHSTQRPVSPLKGAKYVNKEALIKAATEVDKDGKGFWVGLGPLKEFLLYEADGAFLSETGTLSSSIDMLLVKLRRHHAHLTTQATELSKVEKGKMYDESLFEFRFDLFLMSYDNLEKVKEAAICAANIDKKLKQKATERRAIEAELARIRNSLPANIKYEEPEVVRKSLREIAHRNFSRVNKFHGYEATIKLQFQRAEEELSKFRIRLQETTAAALQAQSDVADLRKSFFDLFQENIEEHGDETTEVNLEDLRQALMVAQRNYQAKYLEIVNSFQETKNEANVAVNLETRANTFEFSVLEEALLGHKIRHTDDIATELKDANRGRLDMADELKSNMVAIFDATLRRFKHYKDLVHSVNNFFKGRKISGRYYFSIDFAKNQTLKIELVEEIGAAMRKAARQGELPFDKPVDEIVEEFFRKAARMKDRVPIDDLLNPKTYFDLSVSLADENGIEIPGSTGETYSAIALLGIARLSIVQRNERPGIHFIILEELGSLDERNFNTFPAIAKEFGYQIITMAPTPFRSNMADEWYAHHLIPGYEDQNINYCPSASYFKTKDRSEDLELYLKQTANELDRTEGAT